MPNKTFILCPGQGAQVVGMGKDYFESSPAAREIFEIANRVIGFDLARLCFEGPQDRLNQTDISQPAIYVTSIASFRSAVEAGTVDPSEVTAYAGLSLGEYTALHLAGVFSFEEGLKLVIARGRYMQDAAVAVPSGMVAMLGAEEAAVQELCREAAENGTGDVTGDVTGDGPGDGKGGEVLVLANYNTPGQIVISGSKAACERAVAIAATKGLKATPLAVAGAFHSPLMQPAADKMKAELDQAAFGVPKTTIYSNVTAEPHADPASIKRLLIDQIVSPVKWEQTMVKLITGNETGRLIELAPSRHLAGLAKRISRRLPIESLAFYVKPAMASPV